MRIKFCFLTFLLFSFQLLPAKNNSKSRVVVAEMTGFVNAADFGFKPDASGVENAIALQRAIDKTGTVIVSQSGTYKLANTVYIGSNTTLKFGNNVFLKKVNETGDFSHVILNKGALSKIYDENIVVEGLNIIVNGVDVRKFKEAYGLHGQLAFFYVKDLLIDRFRCLDLGKWQYGIQICTFEDITVNDVIIKGEKDGVHLGRGKRFTISNGVFQTYDDAIALNAHDYATGNPEMGWIENGVVSNCYDLNAENTTGFFCRILGGAWTDWKEGMEVQQSDAVVSNGKVYRVQAKPDGTLYKSLTRPTHESGSKVLDGIKWGVVQNDVVYNAGVRNVVFRDIFLEKQRIAFSIHFDNDRFSRSFYPGAIAVKQEQLLFDNIRILYPDNRDFISVNTPVDVINIVNSSFGKGGIHFHGNKAMENYFPTKINISNCIFNAPDSMCLVKNEVAGKQIILRSTSNLSINDSLRITFNAGNGSIKHTDNK